MLPARTSATLLGALPGVTSTMKAAKKIQKASRPASRWKKNMRTASGMARRTPSRACSSKRRSDSHMGRSGRDTVAALTSSGSLRLRQDVATKTTIRPATQPAAMCAAAQGSETTSTRSATRERPATSRYASESR